MEINNYDHIADLYDMHVPVTFDIDFFLNEIRKASGEVLELTSGTGRVSIPLIEAGVKLTCVDISAESNAILEKKLRKMGLKADVYRGDMCELELQKKFDMIIIPFHSFAHVTSPDDQQKALDHIYQHLLPGGIFICSLGNPALRQQAIDGQLRLLRKYPLVETQGTLLLWTVESNNDDDNQIVEALQFYEEYDVKGVLTSKRILELHFRLSNKDEIEKLAENAGFKVKAFYGDYSHAEFDPKSSPFMIWLMERPSE